mmetsp:Transcript_132971/g.230581  ORF Transcript_132971/g.230581 Transcript_132971/m.230581 type:complete len:223 (+) Transcript_132971:659-1327(+)
MGIPDGTRGTRVLVGCGVTEGANTGKGAYSSCLVRTDGSIACCMPYAAAAPAAAPAKGWSVTVRMTDLLAPAVTSNTALARGLVTATALFTTPPARSMPNLAVVWTKSTVTSPTIRGDVRAPAVRGMAAATNGCLIRLAAVLLTNLTALPTVFLVRDTVLSTVSLMAEFRDSVASASASKCLPKNSSSNSTSSCHCSCSSIFSPICRLISRSISASISDSSS